MCAFSADNRLLPTITCTSTTFQQTVPRVKTARRWLLRRRSLTSGIDVRHSCASPAFLFFGGRAWRRNLLCRAKKDDSEENKDANSFWSIELADFDISDWFGVPTEALEALQEEDEEEEEDGWGKDWEEDWIPDDPEEEEQRKKVNKVLRERQSVMPRDTWLRPMSDAQGILDRVALDEDAVEERLSLEWTANQGESRAALKFVGFLISVPLVVGFALSRAISGPVWGWTLTFDPHAFDVTTQQKLEGAHEIHVEEMRIQLDEAIGMSQPLSDCDLLMHLSEEAYELSEEYIKHNKYALLNVVSDSISAAVFFLMLIFSHEGRRVLFSTVDRIIGGLSDTAKAFMIILLADILLGYHSEEGWTAAIRVISGHYGKEPEESAIYIFVAIVPVILDTCFKYWIFEGLNRQSPAAAVTLKTMDRH